MGRLVVEVPLGPAGVRVGPLFPEQDLVVDNAECDGHTDPERARDGEHGAPDRLREFVSEECGGGEREKDERTPEGGRDGRAGGDQPLEPGQLGAERGELALAARGGGGGPARLNGRVGLGRGRR